MNWYKEYYSEWKEIIETVARETGRTEQMAEKDTIQSMFLHELAKSELPFVFKGGTSLSKAYNLIDRFSEDIDTNAYYDEVNGLLAEATSKEEVIDVLEYIAESLQNGTFMK